MVIAGTVRTNRRKHHKSNPKSEARNQQNLQKPSGVIGYWRNLVEKAATIACQIREHLLVHARLFHAV